MSKLRRRVSTEPVAENDAWIPSEADGHGTHSRLRHIQLITLRTAKCDETVEKK